MYASVAVNVASVAEVFDYHIPTDLERDLGRGCLITVPFGKQIVQGLILGFIDQPSVAETKDILEIVDPKPVLTSSQIALAQWLAEETLSPLALVFNLMLPPGLSQRADVQWSLVNGRSTAGAEFGKVQTRIISLLTKRGVLRSRQIDTHFRNVDWRMSADWLLKRGVLAKKSVLPAPRVRSKYIRVAQLAIPLEEAELAMSDLGKTPATQKRRSAALRTLMRELEEINVSWVYAETSCNL
ncbi:MAG: hypothetical protein QGM50_06170, partial [Anaerolineae bacterium]|nr:hypothetical protein [Anaerolineae bacterium]